VAQKGDRLSSPSLPAIPSGASIGPPPFRNERWLANPAQLTQRMEASVADHEATYSQGNHKPMHG